MLTVVYVRNRDVIILIKIILPFMSYYNHYYWAVLKCEYLWRKLDVMVQLWEYEVECEAVYQYKHHLM